MSIAVCGMRYGSSAAVCRLPLRHTGDHRWPSGAAEVVWPQGDDVRPGSLRRDTPDTEVVTDTTAPAVAVFVKHDAGKNRLDLLPVEALEEIGEVLTFGIATHSAPGSPGEENWRRGAKWNRYFAAALRHLFAWKRGEDRDPESGKSHLAHAACCLLFIITSQKLGLGTDDRWRKP